MQVDASTEVVQITGYDGVAPVIVLRLLTLLAVQVENKQIRLGHSFDNRLAQAPSLHDPHGVGVKGFEQMIDGLADGRKVFRSVNRRRTLVERVRRISAVGPVESLLLLQKIAS